MNLISFFRSLIAVAVYPLLLTVCAIPVVAFAWLGQKDTSDYFVGLWCRWTLMVFGVRVRVQGTPPSPKIGCIYIFNHTSYFDIFALQSVVPWVRFGAKKELFSIPIFGPTMRAVRALPIERGNRDLVFEMYKKNIPRIHNGESFALAPESTRQSTEDLGVFKSGPALFAIQAGCPLVPVVIQGAHAVLDKESFIPNSHKWNSEITVAFLNPFPTKGLNVDDRQTVNEVLRSQMQSSLKRLKHSHSDYYGGP